MQYWGMTLIGCQEQRNMRWSDVQLQSSEDMGRNFWNIPRDKQKQEQALNQKTLPQLSRKCFLSQGVTEIQCEPPTFMLNKKQAFQPSVFTNLLPISLRLLLSGNQFTVPWEQNI